MNGGKLDGVSMLQAFAGNFPGLGGFIYVLFTFIGLYFVGYGLYSAVMAGRPGAKMTASGGIMMSLMGGLLIAVNGWMNILSTTVFDSQASPANILAYSAPSGPSPAAVVISVVIGAVNLIGYIGVLVGSYKWAQLGHVGGGQDRPSFWGGLVYILGGTIAANFLQFLDVGAASIGVSNQVRVILGQ